MEQIAVEVAAPEGTAAPSQCLEAVFPANGAGATRMQRSMTFSVRRPEAVQLVDEIDEADKEDQKKEPQLPGPLIRLMDVVAWFKQGVHKINETEKTRLEVMVSSPRFDLLFGAMIVINALMLILELQHTGHDLGFSLGLPQYMVRAEERMPGTGGLLQTAEFIFVIVFGVELVLRVVALHLKFIVHPWNWLDIIIVTTAIVDQFRLSLFMNATVLRLVRLTKLIRLLKMVRVANKHFEAFFFVVTSICSSAAILFWSLFSIVVVQILCGTIMSQTLRGVIEDTSISEDVRLKLFLDWGTFSRTMLTMFELTFGTWSPSCRLLVDNVHESFAAFFILYKCIVGFGMMTMLTGVFVERASEVAKENEVLAEQEQARVNKHITYKLGKLFDALDVSSDGALSRDELMSMLDDPATRSWFDVLQIDVDDLDKLFDALDDGDGQVSRCEFLEGLQSMKGPAHRMDVVHLHKLVVKIFHRLDGLDAAKAAQIDEAKERKAHGHTVWSKKIQQCAGA
eukprot:gnl/TRDRNA2_/TRDRNA2_177507_c7_seq22.p1 gnl/TRDRNA2_/TRDRNA2_177507_c7~~gnl/TRDRNA2_/TRDRNA2_177507_c7_seq22.p1  ORF type:complete len:511 (+),score=74.83 gnl/TRDRNA2_/TRDRNA2_177507_c7_seq22:545-2077(+)